MTNEPFDEAKLFDDGLAGGPRRGIAPNKQPSPQPKQPGKTGRGGPKRIDGTRVGGEVAGGAQVRPVYAHPYFRLTSLSRSSLYCCRVSR